MVTTIPGQKHFGGKKFVLDSTHRKLRLANQEKKTLKNNKYLCHVVKIGKVYAVYRRWWRES